MKNATTVTAITINTENIILNIKITSLFIIIIKKANFKTKNNAQNAF